jgi:hypothetical protein
MEKFFVFAIKLKQQLKFFCFEVASHWVDPIEIGVVKVGRYKGSITMYIEGECLKNGRFPL